MNALCCPERYEEEPGSAPPYRILVHKAAVVAAGAWSGGLLAAAGAAQRSSQAWLSGLQPRKGHLLELPAGAIGTNTIHRGLMEVGYAKVSTARQTKALSALHFA